MEHEETVEEVVEATETAGNTEINTLTDLLSSNVFNVMYWQEGMGWHIVQAEKSIEEARKIKGRYEQTNQQARIFLEVQ